MRMRPLLIIQKFISCCVIHTHLIHTCVLVYWQVQVASSFVFRHDAVIYTRARTHSYIHIYLLVIICCVSWNVFWTSSTLHNFLAAVQNLRVTFYFRLFETLMFPNLLIKYFYIVRSTLVFLLRTFVRLFAFGGFGLLSMYL